MASVVKLLSGFGVGLTDGLLWKSYGALAGASLAGAFITVVAVTHFNRVRSEFDE
jgi:hypothetical protein